jgi:hypothetical protein
VSLDEGDLLALKIICNAYSEWQLPSPYELGIEGREEGDRGEKASGRESFSRTSIIDFPCQFSKSEMENSTEMKKTTGMKSYRNLK